LSGALLAVAVASVFGGICIAVGVRARFALKALGPPGPAPLVERAREQAGDTAPELVRAEIESCWRGAMVAMDLLLLRFRSAARIALAAGAGSGLVALSSELGQNLTRATLGACACFAVGALAAGMVAQLGHAARLDRQRFRDAWQTQVRESARVVGSRRGEWPDPGGAR
jgi:hypothetical protein